MELYNFTPKPINEQKDGIPFENVISKIDKITLDVITCPICLKLVWDVVDCNQCGNVFCRSCILESLTKVNDSCPLCKYSPVKTTDCKTIKKVLSNIQIKCPNTDCQYNPLYSNYVTHQEKCLYRKYICCNKGCNYENSLNNEIDIMLHSIICRYREIKCKHCGKNIKAINSDIHILQECKFLLFKCFYCKTIMSKYDYLNNHNDYDCAQCLIDYYTMKSIIKKGTIEFSLKESIDRLANNLCAKIKELETENDDLVEKVYILLNKYKKLKQENDYYNKHSDRKVMLNKKRKRVKIKNE